MKNLFAFACLFSLVLFSPGCGKKSEKKTSSAKTGAGAGKGVAMNGGGGGGPGGGGHGDAGSGMGASNDPMGAGIGTGPGPGPGAEIEGTLNPEIDSNPMGGGSTSPTNTNLTPPGTAGGHGDGGAGPGTTGGGNPMPNPNQYKVPPAGNPGGNIPPTGNPGGNIPPTGNPGGSENPMGTPSYGGDSGAAGGTGSPRKAQAPAYPAGSAESAVITLIKNLAKKDYKGNADLISSSAKGFLQDLRSSKPSAQTISRASSMMGAVRLSKKNATQLSSGAQRFTLINSSGLILRFRCIKENGKFVISELSTERGRRRR